MGFNLKLKPTPFKKELSLKETTAVKSEYKPDKNSVDCIKKKYYS